METLAKIVETIAWPATTIFIVLMLRKPLSELVPTLKKLKYKDLELEFEKEANKILSEAERDLPEIPEKPKTKDTGILFSKSLPEPPTQILESWRSLELRMREVVKGNNLSAGLSIRSLISELESKGLISVEIARITLDLAALRNKVAHTDEKIITREVSNAFVGSVKRVRAAMDRIS